MPFHASDSSILAPASTVVLGDTKGARKGSSSLPYGADGSEFMSSTRRSGRNS